MPDSVGSDTTAAAAPTVAPEKQAKVEQLDESQPFYSSYVSKARKTTVLEMLKGLALITVILWIALPIFWGSNWLLLRYFSQMTLTIVDFESPAIGAGNAAVGPLLVQMAEEMNTSPTRPHLGFHVQQASEYPDGPQGVKDAVGFSHYWGGIVINSNCTTAWQDALQQGNASYDPTGCVGVIYSSARFYQITLLYLELMMASFVSQGLKRAGRQALQSYVNTNLNTANALNLAATVPQALATPFSYYVDDVRPINHWAVAAPFEAALIYYIILAFQIAVWGNASRQKTGWNKKLTYPSLVLWRIGLPILWYFWISLMFSLLFKAFLIPTDAAFSNGVGFMVLWMLNWVAMMAVGLALESMISLLGAEFAPFFLIIWIILNITSSFQPIELMEKFYNFLRWLPFVNIVEAYKIITHNTRETHMLGLYFGILFAITAVNMIAIALFVAVERRREEKQMPNKSTLAM